MQSKEKNGVTLVELMVVMLIVVILTVAMTPQLSQFIVKAKYAAEAIPIVGSLITVLQLESTAVSSPSASNRAACANALSDICQATLALQSRGGCAALNDLTGEVVTGSTNAIVTGWIQTHASNLDGRHFASTDLQLRIEHWDPETRSFLFSVAVVGGSRKGGAPAGTGYARLVADFESKEGRRQFAVAWERYSNGGARRSDRLRLRGGGTNDSSRVDAIIVPNLEILRTSDDPGRLLLDLGWK